MEKPKLHVKVELIKAGRVRLHMPLLKGSLPFARLLEERFANHPKVKKAIVNSTFGRVTLVTRDFMAFEELVELLAAMLPGVDVVAVPLLAAFSAAELADLAHLPEAGQAIIRTFREASRGLHRATDGAIDLRLLIPLGVLGFATYLARREPEAQTPLWVAVAFFGYSVFADLNKPRPVSLAHSKRPIDGV
jgi:hypothetical protein